MEKPNSFIRMVNGKTAGIVSILFLILFLVVACEKTKDSNYNPPSDHTVSQGGYMHKSGLAQPLANCVACHGNDLKGGTTGVSCFECHSKKW
jgi:mono/diheme cytochrome c family protein